MHLSSVFFLSLFAANALAVTPTATGGSTSITGCHTDGTDIYCRDEHGHEVLVSATATPASGVPARYTNCHSDEGKTYCEDSDGNEVLVREVETEGTEHAHEAESEHAHEAESEHAHEAESEHAHEAESEHAHESESEHAHESESEVAHEAESEHAHEGESEHAHESESEHAHESESEGAHAGHAHAQEESQGKANCHFHAGVEHCGSDSESSGQTTCGLQTRGYDVPLRIGTLFAILVTSSIGVFTPIVLAKLPFKAATAVVSTVIKQFGTGIIIATAFIHLYTHASLMFANECIGELIYESTTSAIVMAGIFLAFLSEYVGHRVIMARQSSALASEPQETSRKDVVSSEIAQPQNTFADLGHSHGPSSDPTKPNTKFSVLVMEAGIIFHSILIGLTLVVSGDSFYRTLFAVIVFHQFFEGLALGARIAALPGTILSYKALMAGAFALITPIGMAIGLGVLHTFNGNEKSTLVALGTLDALSAGILVWVGVVDMWARDWVIEGGEMLNATLKKVMIGGLSLVTGLVLMGLLGKWA